MIFFPNPFVSQQLETEDRVGVPGCNGAEAKAEARGRGGGRIEKTRLGDAGLKDQASRPSRAAISSPPPK